MTAARVSPSVALAAYAEAWISGAKVVVFGDALSPLAERLVERGARHVQVYDVDAVRAREAGAASASKHISHAPLELAGSSLRDGAFDVGIVEDLASAGKDPKGLLATLARSLSRRGLALIGSRNPDVPARLIRGAVAAEQPLGYYDFYDAVSQHFDEVRMLGQTPFVGYAIADFSAADANDVRIDTALLPSGAEEPEWFLALGSALPVSPDAFSVIQLPIADVDLGASTGRAELDPESMERVENAETRIRELEAALAELAAEGAREAEKHAAERARDAEKHAAERVREAEKHAAERARDAEKQAGERREGERKELEKGLAQKLQVLQAELEKREEWLAGLESRAATADERADQAQAQLEQAAKEQRKTKEQIARLEQQLEDERRAKRQLEEHARAHEQDVAKRDRRLEAETQRAAELASQSKALAARVAELTAALAQSERAARKRAEEGDEEVRAELLQLEALLKDRAAEVGRLTEALHETERFGRQLIIKLGELQASSADAPESPDLQGLTRRNAELAADLEAARWTISSLEANVGAQPTASTSAAVNQRRDDMTPAEPAPGADG